jgi:mannosyltransferase
MTNNSRRRVDGVLLAIIGLAVVLRFWRLGSQSFWLDEWLTTKTMSGSVSQLLRHVEQQEGIPPLYFFVIRGWGHLFGDSEVALRFPSALAGVATVPVVYATVRVLGQRQSTARVAALLVAVSPMMVWYSQEARPYAIVAFLAALTLYAFASVHQRGERRDYIVWGVCCALGIAFHYFVVYLVAAEAIALLVSRRAWRLVSIACVPSILVLAALTPIALEQHSHKADSAWISNFALAARLRDAGHNALLGPAYPTPGLFAVGLIVIVVAVLLLVLRANRETRAAAAYTAGIGIGAVVLPYLLALAGFDIFLSRYLIAALIPLIISLSIALTAARVAWVTAICVTVLCLISVSTVVAVARDPRLQRADWGSVAAAFQSGNSHRLLYLNTGGNQARALYYYLPGIQAASDNEPLMIDEIDVLTAKGDKEPCNFYVGMTCSLVFLGAKPLPASLANQFTIASHTELARFRIDRYRARKPVAVKGAQLVAPGSTDDSLVLVPSAAQQ